MSLSTLLAALALVTAGVFVALAFTAWGRRRPLHRYGALSVAAHLLLLAGLATVRTGAAPSPGADDAPPVRVSLVMREAITPPEPETKPEPESTPPEPAPEVETLPELPTETAEVAEPEPPAQEPEPSAQENVALAPYPIPPQVEAVTLPEPTLTPETTTLVPPPSSHDQAWSGLPAEPVLPPLPPPPSPAPPRPETQTLPEPIPRAAPEPQSVQPPVTPAPPLAPSAYAQRGELLRRVLSENQGGDDETLDAVAAAVDWLARAQGPNGAWEAAAWGAGRETRTLGEHRRNAGMRAETGLTGLALLAMGGVGHSHLAGPYRDTVTRGLQYLLDTQGEDGNLAGAATPYARTYCHSMATFALAEMMAFTGDQRLRPSVEAAVAYLERMQNHASGGWRYGSGDRGDTSQMGWAIMALRSAELAGVAVEERTWSNCERFLTTVRRGSEGGLAAYQPRGRMSNTMTAEAMYCRQILGVACRACPAADEAVSALLTDLPGGRHRGRESYNLYYWYYATLALHHHRAAGGGAESDWRTWNDAARRAILVRQRPDGPQAGSWDPDSVWAGYGGRVYATALAAMCLEVDYRYDAEKIGRDPWIAAREAPIRR